MISIYVSLDSNNSIGSEHGCVDFPEEICNHTRKKLNGMTVIVDKKHSQEVASLLPDSALLLIRDKKDAEYNTVKKTLVVNDFASLMIILFEEQDVVIVGGPQILKEAEPYVDMIYVNRFKGEFVNGARKFPEDFDWGAFDLTYKEINKNDDRITHEMYSRKEQ